MEISPLQSRGQVLHPILVKPVMAGLTDLVIRKAPARCDDGIAEIMLHHQSVFGRAQPLGGIPELGAEIDPVAHVLNPLELGQIDGLVEPVLAPLEPDPRVAQNAVVGKRIGCHTPLKGAETLFLIAVAGHTRG